MKKISKKRTGQHFMPNIELKKLLESQGILDVRKSLAEIPFEKLAIGDECISAIGNRGRITNLISAEENKEKRFVRSMVTDDFDDSVVFVRWENNIQSVHCHEDFAAVIYLGLEENR